MRLISPEFEHFHSIPDRFTCTGHDINPELLIEDVPGGAQSLALVVLDPDSQYGTWVHWLVYDIPVISRIYEQSVPGKQGINSFGEQKYGGPCPAQGTHRYFFTLYALDTMLNLPEDASLEALRDAMADRVMATAELVGLYKKPAVPDLAKITR
jgi:Raf kinase inhibitor-like YbhB/YbcL family protein